MRLDEVMPADGYVPETFDLVRVLQPNLIIVDLVAYQSAMREHGLTTMTRKKTFRKRAGLRTMVMEGSGTSSTILSGNQRDRPSWGGMVTGGLHSGIRTHLRAPAGSH